MTARPTPHEPSEGLLEMTVEQARCFAEPTRNDIMTLLAERPATTKQIAEALGKPKGSVGHHLKVLEEAGLIRVVRTRKVRAITEKYYGRVVRTYVFPRLEEDGDHPPFMLEALEEMREPSGGEESLFTLRHARIPAEWVHQFAAEVIELAEAFAAASPGGDTVYGFIAGVYPTDRPSLKEDDE
jgi:DNA-binding transcriptional ArsR family regulator